MIEEDLRNLIIQKYGSIRQFALKINVPYTTIDTILKRGINNSNVTNVIKICKALNISTDKLIDDNQIVSTLVVDNALNSEKQKMINNIVQLFKEKGFIDDKGNVKEDAFDLIDMAVKLKDISDKKKEN